MSHELVKAFKHASSLFPRIQEHRFWKRGKDGSIEAACATALIAYGLYGDTDDNLVKMLQEYEGEFSSKPKSSLCYHKLSCNTIFSALLHYNDAHDLSDEALINWLEFNLDGK